MLRGRPGAETAHAWFGEVDGRSESVLESFARLECVDAGVPPDDLQHEFFDESGRFLGRADLAWKLPGSRWLVVEIDGDEFHSSRMARSRDAERQNGLVSDGRIVVLRYTYDHLRHRGHVGEQVRSTLARLGRTAGHR
ncbi:endonuclease domain-containing protein [Antribacter sp. KLBMP9083]|uniref:Endonuclease domain-containing protein n=1 Tax=Antribacter soli TaxID=2910976 RepID=A0AA41QGS8_9MICO|nr:endonuclease domain-containing protein [Antribacter soli]MCF4122361.1 endonuclease domain-containing protein [Antribacter soli]